MSTETTDVVFLGINEVGMRVYEWLCERKGVFVQSLLTTREQLGMIKELQPDYVVSCGFRHIVPSDVLSVPTGGCINLHPSYLPYNRGANPNVWSIVEGTPAGVAIHYMDESIDTGPIVARRKVETSFSDSGKDLYERLEDALFELFTSTWPDIEDDQVEVTEQEPSEGTRHVTADFDELCKLDPDAEYTVKELLDRLRALTFPGYDNAFVELEDGMYYVEVDIEKA